MPESITPHENLEHIFNGILSLNQDGQHISQGKRQLDTKRPYPDIWVNNVSEDTSDEATNGEEASSEDVGSASDDDTPETYYPIEPEIAAQEMVDDELCHKIALWVGLDLDLEIPRCVDVFSPNYNFSCTQFKLMDFPL